MQLLSAGSNACGQLGHGNIDDSHVFQAAQFSHFPETSTARVLDLACGANHTLVLVEFSDPSGLETTREVWGCGDGSVGQLGPLHREQDVHTFRRLDIPHEQDDYQPKLITAAWQTSFIVLECPDKPDLVMSMGSNDFGDLGTSPFGPKIPGVDFVTFSNLVKDDSRLTGLFTVHSIVAGQHHVVASISTPEAPPHLVGWGAARHGQLGGDDASIRALPRVIRTMRDYRCVALGAQHTAILLSNQSLVALGSNRKYQTEGLDELEGVQMVGCTWNGTYCLTNHGIVSKGLNTRGQLGRANEECQPDELVELPEHLQSIKKLACGSEHVVLLVGDGERDEVWGWGWNEHGNLGLGTTDDVPRPVKLWSESSSPIENVWGGPGTTWICV